MTNLLFERIRDLENKIEKISSLKSKILKLFKECKIPKEKKEKFKKELKKVLEEIEVEKNNFFENNFLKYEIFLELIKNSKNGYLVLIDASFPNEIQYFILGFLVNKISPFFTLKDNLILGFIDEEAYKELKSMKTIPYYNPLTLEFIEIPLYKVFFSFENLTKNKILRAKEKFNEFKIRPTYKNKHFIEYSLELDKLINFEREKLNKEKKKFKDLMEEPFANLEIKLKRNNDLSFVLAILEKIDSEIDKIKSSKGIMNIVIRILNYIEFKFPEFKEEVQYLRKKLKENL